MNPIQHGVGYPVRFGSGPRKAFLLTHTDLDGIACELAFRISKMSATHSFECRRIDYNEPGIAAAIPDDVSVIYVTDIKGTDELWNILVAKNVPVVVIDHHQWHQEPKDSIELLLDEDMSAALSTYLYTSRCFGLLEPNETTDLFFNYADGYDMWRKDKNFDKGKVLNHLLHTIGKDKFVETMIHRMISNTEMIARDEMKDYEHYQSGIKDKAERLVQQMVMFKDNDGHTCGFIITDSVQSDVMYSVLEQSPSIEYLALYNRIKKNVSLRRQDSSNIDLSILAARYGGGGHKAAAGYPMSEHIVKGYRV